ncbi:biotin--protein ligase [archaeon]|nr:biotin--protein ligase [archaeon]|tara:strand:- start:308 stop:598 length:291 start_codon:yes stop_codon:yes gene_type:complete
MQGRAQKKVAGGKLVKVWVEYTPGKILNVQILGDFFLHPEEGIERLEKSVVGVSLPTTQDTLATILKKTLRNQRMELLGAHPPDIAEAIMEAMVHG